MVTTRVAKPGFVPAPQPDWLDKKVRQWQEPKPGMPTGGRPLDPSNLEELAKIRSMSQAPVFGVIEDDQVRSGAYNPAKLLRAGEIDKVATADLVRYLESPGMHSMLQRAIESKRPMEIDVVSIMRTLYSRLKNGGEGHAETIQNSPNIKYSYPAKVAPQFEFNRRPVIKESPFEDKHVLVLVTGDRPFELALYPDDKVKLHVLQGQRQSPQSWSKILASGWTEVQAPKLVRKAA